MCHEQGGWPKEVNHREMEHVTRYIRKVKREEVYMKATVKLATRMNTCIRQNNTIDIYTDYFTDDDDGTGHDEPALKSVNIYRQKNLGSGSD